MFFHHNFYLFVMIVEAKQNIKTFECFLRNVFLSRESKKQFIPCFSLLETNRSFS